MVTESLEQKFSAHSNIS